MFGMGLGVPMMAGLKTAPSFMSRMGSAMPGAVNAMAGRFGDPSMSQGVQAASGALRPPAKRMQKPPMQPPQMNRGGMGGQMGGINTGPQSLPFMQGGTPPWMNRNTGISGGMMGRFNQMF